MLTEAELAISPSKLTQWLPHTVTPHSYPTSVNSITLPSGSWVKSAARPDALS